MRTILLIQKRQPLQQQVRVVDVGMQDERFDEACSAAGEDEGGGGAEFGFDALHHAVEHGRHADNGAGEDAFFGVSADDVFRGLEIESWELGGPLGEGVKSHVESRCDGSAAEHAVFPDDIKCRCCSKIYSDNRQRIMCGGPGGIDEAVAAYFFRLRDGKRHAEITFGCDEQRLHAEPMADTFLQKRQNRRDDAGNDDSPKVGRGKIFVFEKLPDRRLILAGRPCAVDVNPGCKFEGIHLRRGLNAAERNGCIPDIDS